MGARVKTLPEILIRPIAPGQYVASNPFVGTHAVGDDTLVELLGLLTEALPEADVAEHFKGRGLVVEDATESPFRDGLLGDPTGLRRDASTAGARHREPAAALDLLRRLMLVTTDEAAYQDHLAPRRNVLDRDHRGNLHQRVGEYVMFELRERDLDRWWADQKFSGDRRGPRDGPYRFVQWEFMDRHFTADRLEGRRVLDFGCGPGLFTRLFARRGATVVATDTNAAHLATAEALLREEGLLDAVTLSELGLPAEQSLKALGEGEFDLILLSDVLMFYFHPYDESADLDPVRLLATLREMLAPGGTIVVMEPHGVFWQQPRLGAAERPFTILTEYRSRRYGVTPTLDRLSAAVESAGLTITRIRELASDGGDRHAEAFAAEFPLWWLFELRAAAPSE